MPENISLQAARVEAEELTTRILEAKDAYYGRDTSLVVDATYDGWMHRLEELERVHPELVGQDSPTQMVGAADATGLATIEHAETVIRNYDPCISCATHFLDLRISRRET